MAEEIVYYCQECDEKITIEQLASLDAGKCPKCGSIEGFSTFPKDSTNGFKDDAVILNEAIFLED
ncbi:hypothetical protein [Sulfurimonas sp.]|uniref:hypothetical protein n=1 Tax=Sulfurimonas sp. TaxID=2022749 RepID=UPI003D0B191A